MTFHGLEKNDFAQDGNYGLAVRCIHRLRAKAIFRLRETYLTVSLQEVAQAFGEGDVSPELLAEAENTILELVRSHLHQRSVCLISTGTNRSLTRNFTLLSATLQKAPASRLRKTQNPT